MLGGCQLGSEAYIRAVLSKLLVPSTVRAQPVAAAGALLLGDDLASEAGGPGGWPHVWFRQGSEPWQWRLGREPKV